jgi:hypothetical protein
MAVIFAQGDVLSETTAIHFSLQVGRAVLCTPFDV